jgi:hypothetical protein
VNSRARIRYDGVMQEHGALHYFERRAEEERDAARRATNERAARSHRELAEQYLKRASGAEQFLDNDPDVDAGILSKDFQIVP